MRRRHIIAAALACGSLLIAAGVLAATTTAHDGTLIKSKSSASVYYYGGNGKRYAFPNEHTYSSWYDDFSGVATITDADLAAIPLGGNVTYKPGVRLVKVQTDPKVYAVDANGTLRPIKDEAAAKALYGDDWNKRIDDIPDAFFTNYAVGAEIDSADDFSPDDAETEAADIATDRHIPKNEGGIPGSSVTLDLTKLPLGDGKYTSNGAKKGYVYVCQTAFNGGGAQQNGSWINTSAKTWDATKKIAVKGSVDWPTAAYSMTVSGSDRKITSNGLPVGSNTGTFPVAASDPAYQIDRNPNTIKATSISLTLPANPTLGTTAKCVRGQVGIGVNGVPIFDGFDAEGRDAVAHEVQDSCGGHPQESGNYHYHSASDCIVSGGANSSKLLGYAYDGFGIYGSKDASGKTLTTADLDECHGITSQVLWDGKSVSMYHYVATSDFPYTVGCFKGSVSKEPTPSGAPSGGTTQQGGGSSTMPPPPPEDSPLPMGPGSLMMGRLH